MRTIIRFKAVFRSWIRIQSGLDSDSIWSLDPDTDRVFRSGSRKAKMTHHNKKKVKTFLFFEGLNVLFGGLNFFSSEIYFQIFRH
jgi:hypothetical protein